ncbi:uncharacterized protein B0T15DRAFT_202581 [Chaetomium strumarium]|uniref:Uncharacterized protein n=1 Tax=Chaetomium strumarium TaxID=1170767 RepID=A0AAJ0GT20_9PEZI|nr:hypothetical protein B0T15DRAFT_202581 [Chaetomium strumarium]
MGCCGLFKKHKKNKVHDQGFAVRPVQQTVNGGNVSYHPSSQQYQYGGSGGRYQYQDPNHAARLAANRALAQGAAMGINGATHGKYSKYVGKGANMAADQFTKYQEKQGRCSPQP